MPGHIGIGAPGALREYMIENLNLYTKAPANQFAAKLSTGGGSYDDLQNWSYFAMEDWRAGIGKKDPEAGGTLYSELETRYPNRLTLPNAVSLDTAENTSYSHNYGYQAGRDLYPDTTLDIGTGETVQRIAHAIDGNGAAAVHISLYLPNSGQSVTVELWTSTGTPSVPNAIISSMTKTIATEDKPGYGLYMVRFGTTLTDSTPYHIVIYPTTPGETLALPMNSTDVTSGEAFSTYDGSTWSNYTDGSFLHGVLMRDFDGSPSAVARFNNKVYMAAGGELYVRNNDSTLWAEVSGLPSIGDITDLLVVGDELWIGSTSEFQKMSAGEIFTDSGLRADLFLLANGYVWRADQGDVYYTGDGTTWTGPITVGWDGFAVRGMAAMGDYIYCSTDDGLYYIGYGEEVVYVTSWASISSTNGAGMINHQGTLFIPVQQSLYRFDGQSMIPVGLDMGEGLPADRLGTVAGIVSLNNWLIVFINDVEVAGRQSAWAYNDQGWHFIARIPEDDTTTTYSGIAAGYDIVNRRLYIASSVGTVWQLPISDSANFNNISAYPTPKMPAGWMETDWFFGNLFEVYKDMESLYVSGDGIDSTHTVKLYWMDDDSTDWEYLGTVAAGRGEVRWSDYSKRPNTRQIKVGVLLETQSDTAPVVRVIRLKYHPMVSDWFRWSFPILCSDYQELLGPDVSTYTRAQQAAHLDEMIKRVPPFIFRDLDSNEYEVKVMGCQIQAVNYRYKNPDGVIPAEAVDFDYIYSITLEQIRSEGYEA